MSPWSVPSPSQQCLDCVFALPQRQPCLCYSLLCQAASELRAQESMPSLRCCSPTLEAARPGPGAALSRHCRTRGSGRSCRPGLAGPSNNRPSVPSAGPAPMGPPTSSQLSSTHFRLRLPRPLCPPGEQASFLPGQGVGEHKARPGNRFCGILRAGLGLGWEPGGLWGRSQALPLPCTEEAPSPTL